MSSPLSDGNAHGMDSSYVGHVCFIDISTPRLFGIVEILEAHLLFSCWSRPTIPSGIPSDITDTRDTSGIIDTRGTFDVFQPAPSTSSAPSISATEPRQNGPHHPDIAVAAPSTPRTSSSAPLLRH